MQILRSIRKIMRAVDLHSRKIHSDLAVTLPQLLCLHALAEQEDMTLMALSRTVNLSNSTVNGIVDRLEAKGLLTRKRDEEDRRRVALALSAAGRRVVESAPSLLQDRLADALRRLPEPEQATIARSLDRVVDLMEPVTSTLPPTCSHPEPSKPLFKDPPHDLEPPTAADHPPPRRIRRRGQLARLALADAPRRPRPRYL